MKILVNVYVPAVGERYDVLVPDSVRIRSAVSLIAGAVEELSGHRYVSSGVECLCSAEKNIRLKSSTTLKKYGIQNGDHLIIM